MTKYSKKSSLSKKDYSRNSDIKTRHEKIKEAIEKSRKNQEKMANDFEKKTQVSESSNSGVYENNVRKVSVHVGPNEEAKLIRRITRKIEEIGAGILGESSQTVWSDKTNLEAIKQVANTVLERKTKKYHEDVETFISSIYEENNQAVSEYDSEEERITRMVDEIVTSISTEQLTDQDNIIENYISQEINKESKEEEKSEESEEKLCKNSEEFKRISSIFSMVRDLVKDELESERRQNKEKEEFINEIVKEDEKCRCTKQPSAISSARSSRSDSSLSTTSRTRLIRALAKSDVTLEQVMNLIEDETTEDLTENAEERNSVSSPASSINEKLANELHQEKKIYEESDEETSATESILSPSVSLSSSSSSDYEDQDSIHRITVVATVTKKDPKDVLLRCKWTNNSLDFSVSNSSRLYLNGLMSDISLVGLRKVKELIEYYEDKNAKCESKRYFTKKTRKETVFGRDYDFEKCKKRFEHLNDDNE